MLTPIEDDRVLAETEIRGEAVTALFEIRGGHVARLEIHFSDRATPADIGLIERDLGPPTRVWPAPSAPADDRSS